MSNKSRSTITRRMFLRGSVTLLVSAGVQGLAPKAVDEAPASILPVLGPREARADNIVVNELPVVGKDQVGFVLHDVANNNAPIADAQIVVTSLFDKDKHPDDPKVATATTLADGTAIIDIKDLSILDDKQNPLNGAYQCIAEVQITTPGSRKPMRNYSTGKALLEGASGITIPMHSLLTADKDGDYGVYIERLTFDGWDMHYCTGTFLRGPHNTDSHTICCRIFGVTEAIDVTLDFLDANDTTIKARDSMKVQCSKDNKSGLYEANFKGCYLSTDKDDEGDVIKKDKVILRFSFDYKGKHYESDEVMELVDEPLNDVTYTSPMSLLPAKLNSILSFSMDADLGIPVFTGFKVQIVDWNFPFTFFVTPATVVFGIGHDFAMVDEQGNIDPNAWKQQSIKGTPLQLLKKRRNQMMDDIKHMCANRKQPYLDDASKATNKKILGKFNFNVIFRGVAAYEWAGFDKDPKLFRRKWDVKYQVYAGATVSGSVTKQMMLGNFPVYVSLSASAEVVFGYGGEQDKIIVGENPTLDMTNEILLPKNEFSIDPSFMLSVSAGVGLAGVASVGVSATIGFSWHMGFFEDPDNEKANPHTTLSIIIRFEICFQFLGLKVSGIIWDFPKKTKLKNPIVNNWSSQSLEEDSLGGMAAFEGIEPRFALADAGGKKYSVALPQGDGNVSLSDLLDNAVLVGDSDMAHSNEATGTKGASAAPIGQGPSPTIRSNMAPAFVSNGNGGFDVVLKECEGINTFDFGSDASSQDDAVNGSSTGQRPASEEAMTPADAGDVSTSSDMREPTPNTGALAEEELGVADDPAPGTAGAGDPDAMMPTAELEFQDPVVAPVVAEMGIAEEGGASQKQKAEDDDAMGVAGGGADNAELGGADNGKRQMSTNDVTKDFFLGMAERSGVEYSYTYEPGKTTGKQCPSLDEAFAAKVAAQNATNAAQGPGAEETIIAEHDGVVPAVDVVIYEDVFSDTRQRVVVVDKIPYLFRIITVTYPGGVHRSRIAASKFDFVARTWGEPTVIEFMSGSTNPTRLDMYDYDFDVAVRTGDAPWADDTDICLVITGGTRPNGDNTSMYEVFENATLSVVLLDKDLNAHQQTVMSVSDLFKDNKCHLVMCPRITDGFSPLGTSGVLGISFLTRTADSNENIMSNDSSLATVSFGVGYYHLYGQFMTAHIRVDCPAVSNSASSLEVVAGGDPSKSVMQILVVRSDGYDLFSAIIEAGQTIGNLALRHNIQSDDPVAEVQPWPLKGSFLYTFNRPEDGEDVDYHLYEGTFDVNVEDAARFSPVQVDANGLKGAAFAVSPTGEYLFYFDSYRGDTTLPAPVEATAMAETDDEPNGDGMHNITNNDLTKDVNRIMASRYVDGKFSEDFVFCELEYPADHIRCMQITAKETVFIINEITDLSKSLGQIHYVGVPNLMVAEVEAFSSVGPFVYTGTMNEFSVDVRSHGNMIIEGFVLQLLDADNGYQLVGEPYVVNKVDPSKIMLTARNVDWTDPSESDDGSKFALSEAEQQGKLMPGKSMTYRAEFEIPSTWKTSRKLAMTLTDVRGPAIQLDGIQAQALVDDGHKYLHSGAVGTVQLFDNEVTTQSYDPEERVTSSTSEGSQSSDGGTSGANAAGGSSKNTAGGSVAGSTSTKIPNTGDPTSIAGPLGLAAAGLGAAFAAYSARRSRIENEEE